MSKGGRPLVITDSTLLVRRANERLVMVREKKVVASIPIRDVSHVAVHGPVTLTGAAVAGLLDAGVEVTLHSSSGRYRGTITGAQSGNVFLLLAQADAWKQADKRVAVAQAIIAGKIAGQRSLVHRRALDRGSLRCEEAAKRLASHEATAWGEGDLEALRGVEGVASAEYFGVFDELLSEGWRWPGRVRRPPRDPVNALLSFGYTLLTGEIVRVLMLRGFDTRIGLLHGLRYGRESLALDMMEEFRAVMVDRFVLKLLNNRQLKAEDFEAHDDGAVRLSHDARRNFLEWWESLLRERAPVLRNERPDGDSARAQVVGRGDVLGVVGVNAAEDAGSEYTDEGAPVTWQVRMERQVQRLYRYLMHREPYIPMTASRRPEGVDGERRGSGAAKKK